MSTLNKKKVIKVPELVSNNYLCSNKIGCSSTIEVERLVKSKIILSCPVDFKMTILIQIIINKTLSRIRIMYLNRPLVLL